MQTLPIGTSLQDSKYTIKQVLGQGGFGITYLAEHELLGKVVAIKEFFFKQYCNRDESSSQVTLGTQSAQEEVARYQEKFLKEARVIARLNHPNIIKVHDIFKENNTAYYVMDYIEGKNLAEIIQQRGSLPEEEAIHYIRQVADALSYIHAKQLNHLDVKPANLMLRGMDGQIVLIDFGTSKQYDIVSGNQTSTTPVGLSHGYAPIEQYKEGGVKEFSPETDIYALGATLYKMLTGITPPQATEIVAEGWDPVYTANVSTTTQAAIAKSMEIRKVNRYHDVNAFLQDLGTNTAQTQTIEKETTPETMANEEENRVETDEEATRLTYDAQSAAQEAAEEAWRKTEEEDRKRKAEEEKKKRIYAENARLEELHRKEEEERQHKRGCWKAIGIFVAIIVALVIGGICIR